MPHAANRSSPKPGLGRLKRDALRSEVGQNNSVGFMPRVGELDAKHLYFIFSAIEGLPTGLPFSSAIFL